MYQIEFRPGWRWMRDFKKFNASMRDEEGRFRFNGPYCRIKDWIELSREIGVDYHILEIKWHDGDMPVQNLPNRMEDPSGLRGAVR
jgi:hypothetical protein